MLLQDPPTHTRLRKLVKKAFTPRAIEAWRPRVEAITQELLDRVAGSGRMDLIADLARPVPATLICELLGVPTKDLSGKVPKDLPRGYGRDRIVVMVRDPYWLHCYWELTRKAACCYVTGPRHS